jgi:hypothetical protein
MTVWFITGASRGFGIEITRQALGRGDQVAATARHPEAITQATRTPVTPSWLCRSTSPAPVRRPRRSRQLSRGSAGSTCLSTTPGAACSARSKRYPTLRRERSSRSTSSACSLSPAPFFPSCASRARGRSSTSRLPAGSSGALAGGLLRDEVRGRGPQREHGYELAPLGIQVTAIEPGAFRTNFLDGSSLLTAEVRIEDYAGTAGASRQWAKQTSYAQAGDPVKAAKVIVGLAGRESLPERIQLGEDCFTAVARKLARIARDQARWREISISTGYHP